MMTAILGCVVLAGGSGVVYIFLLRENPVCMTWAANLCFPAICFFLGLFFMPFGLILWIFAALALCMLFCWREQLELAAKLLGMAAQTLLDNGGLIPVKFLLMVMELLFTLPIVVFNVA